MLLILCHLFEICRVPRSRTVFPRSTFSSSTQLRLREKSVPMPVPTPRASPLAQVGAGHCGLVSSCGNVLRWLFANCSTLGSSFLHQQIDIVDPQRRELLVWPFHKEQQPSKRSIYFAVTPSVTPPRQSTGALTCYLLRPLRIYILSHA